MHGRIIIAGAGIGGLAAAACLLKAGHDVDIYEQAPQLGEVGAGIQQSANSMHVMRHLGLAERIAEVGVRPEGTQFRIYNTGEVLQELELGRKHEERHGEPYYQLHRADFHALLADCVRALKPDAIHLDASATGFEEDADGVTLHFADGSSVTGDALIGADGIKSVIRKQIAGEKPPVYTGDAAWRLVVPTERLPKGMSVLEQKSTIWVGPNKHAVIYLLRGGELLNFVTAVECEEWIDESWTQKYPWEDLKADLEGWHEEIQTIVDKVDRDQCYRWALNVHPAAGTWSTKRATLLGDAAHPTLPYLAQGAVMAVEDGAVFSRAIDQAESVTGALRLYEHNRIDRTARIVRESNRNRELFHLQSIEELKAAFAKRNMDKERSNWLYSYNPMTVELETPPKA